ncbi:lipid A-modifier LpxR family protein [Hyunsoonleella pacifica]|uniref:DUF2219 family protein n=1 Tax=Hyunsoonleella pacifica TaxID=1080224 RepID=A0A4Q9FM39_9FLAO|nr:lipid A-modifier LpxR family protein [Hyunsoonleella pacifica]TBN14437.1 DUF2219 family protein [Hyunsoonleella pacifica]GGD13747.1 hypothetical protein GCM10011368_14640 [Hyunsoonleella pacifica]
MYTLQILKIWSFLVLGLLGCNVIVSQDQQIEIRISNDKFVFQDKYYTNGLHITYRKNVNSNILFKKTKNEKLQTNISIGNETYTPSNLFSFDTNDFDRPYAGWLFGSLELGKIKSNSALFLALESGITGEASLAGKLQNAFHGLLNIEKPTWEDEIAFKWLFNFKIKKIYNFQISKNLDIQNRASLSLGSKDTYLQNNVFLFFGKFNDFQNSYRIQALDATFKKEFFGFIGGGYKYVALNTLIQGSPFRNNDPFTSIAENHVFNMVVGSALKIRNQVYKIEFNYNSKETPLSKSHIYGMLVFGFGI